MGIGDANGVAGKKGVPAGLDLGVCPVSPATTAVPVAFGSGNKSLKDVYTNQAHPTPNRIGIDKKSSNGIAHGKSISRIRAIIDASTECD